MTSLDRISNKLHWLPQRFRDRGMVFGTVQWLSERGIHECTRRIFNVDQKSKLLRITAKALEMIASFAIAWAVLTRGGFPLTLRHALNVMGVNLLYSVALGVLLNYLSTFPAVRHFSQKIPKWLLPQN